MLKLKLSLLAACAALCLSSVAPATAEAQVGGDNPFGLGLALGYPDVGLSAQYFTAADTSLQFALSFWYRDGRFGNRFRDARSSGLFLRADYLFHPNVLVQGNVAALGWYVGPGAYAGFGEGSNIAVGVELPIGLDVRLQSAPVLFALELVPRLGFLDSAGTHLNFGVGGTLYARYFF